MNEWFRSWHGAPTDPKWLGIARRAGVAPGIAVAVAWALMDRASQASDRGSIKGYDAEGLAYFYGCEPEQVDAIVAAMTDKGMIADSCFTDRRMFIAERDHRRLGASDWRDTRDRIFERDDYTCAYCGSRGGKLECDHVHPVSRGGSNAPSNLVTACFACNRAKRNKTVAEWKK